MYAVVGQKQGVPQDQHRRHRPERRAQGVRRARHVHLPAEAVAAAGRRPHGLLRPRAAALQRDQHQRLPHPRRRLHRRAGDGLHLRQRHRLHRGGARARRRRRRLRRRASPGSSTRRTTSSKRSPSTAPCAACGRGSCGSASAPRTRARDAAHPRPDRRRHAHRPAAGGQHRPGGAAGAGHACSAASSRWRSPATTRRWPCRPRRRSASPCAPSRSSPTRAASPTPSTRWPAPTTSSALTNELEKKAWEYLRPIEDMGGAVAAIESGYVQREIQEASYAYQQAVDEGEQDHRRRQQVPAGGRGAADHLPRRTRRPSGRRSSG